MFEPEKASSVNRNQNSAGPVTVAITAHLIGNAPSFPDERYGPSTYNVTNRQRTSAVVHWEMPVTEVGNNVFDLTPDLTPLIEEVLAAPGWRSGNAIAFLF